ncbi:hypothetical protein B0H10DRAFT_1991104 [Mycena sp. CBHHK59/15]|nr:hypothetical protein B0H10DRAFT_1991104 [Mycena sp. CBHHK59/15]
MKREERLNKCDNEPSGKLGVMSVDIEVRVRLVAPHFLAQIPRVSAFSLHIYLMPSSRIGAV